MIIQGDCLEVLKTYPDNHFTSVITDPPYGLSFMGKKWDYDIPSVDIWKECLRVLKPGGTMLCFAGSRTQHRMAVNIEDAGFLIKDCLMYLYGSGFPKSLNVGKQLDKRGGQCIGWFGAWLRKWRIENKITQQQISKLFPSKTGGLTGCVANWELGFNLPTANQFSKICEEFKLPFESIQEAEREIIGKGKSGKTAIWQEKGGMGEFNVTTPSTDQAKFWESYGTALKPAYEPIIMCMKPNDGTYAENAIKHGVAGINIDKSRIEGKEKLVRPNIKREYNEILGKGLGAGVQEEPQGRFPSNLILDEEAGQMLDEQTGVLKTGAMKPVLSSGKNDIYGKRKFSQPYQTYAANSGGASRFFYCAKASKAERNAGCEELEEKECQSGCGGAMPIDDQGKERDRFKVITKNHHPTVKPLALMKYLINLIMPPKDGLILDPFAGSGTTILAAKQLGYNAIGIEKELEYCEIANKRLEAVND